MMDMILESYKSLIRVILFKIIQINDFLERTQRIKDAEDAPLELLYFF
jgi:hypothetical protein